MRKANLYENEPESRVPERRLILRGIRAIPSVPVYLLHGKGGSPEGSVRKLQEVLEKHWQGVKFIRPSLPHRHPAIPAEASVEYLQGLGISAGSLLIGISLGGLVAAQLRVCAPEGLYVIAISAPAFPDGVELKRRAKRRVVFYSLSDPVTKDRNRLWPLLADYSCDF